MATNIVPSPKDQRKIIEELNCRGRIYYYIDFSWYEAWEQYVGFEGSTLVKPAEPGPILCDFSQISKRIDVKVWQKLVQWYGVAENHLPARYFNTDELCTDVSLKVCIRTEYEERKENTMLTYRIRLPESVEYLHKELSRILHVPRDTPSCIWIKIGKQGFKLLNDSKTFFFSTTINGEEVKKRLRANGISAENMYGLPEGTHVVALELKDIHESYHSGAPGKPQPFREQLTSQSTSTDQSQPFCTASSDDVTDDLRTGTESLTLHDDSREKEPLYDNVWPSSDFEKEKEVAQNEIKTMEHGNKFHSNLVKLNIGGVKFQTSISTLTKHPNSILATMLSGRHSPRQQKDGSYFIDRDGTHFRYILNYLRDGGAKLKLPADPVILEEVRSEAEFYQLQDLVQLLSVEINK